MLLDLIYGGIGTGKTEKCIELIKRTMKKNPEHNAIITVPDQYSYSAEKRLVDSLGGTGLNGIEVVTFSQFFNRYIKKEDAYLTPSGKQMLFYEAIRNQNDESSIFKNSIDKSGFVEKVSELAIEMKRNLITPQELREISADKTDMLSQKLRAFSLIYEEYNKLLGESFMDSDDDFERFADFIENTNEFEKTHICFDGFADFMPQHYRVIKAFLNKAQAVHISLPIPLNSDREIYALPLKTKETLIKMAESVGARIYEQHCEDRCYTIKSDEIKHLMDNWDNHKNKYNEKTEDISIFCSRDLYSEIEFAAKRIIEEVKNGARYKDISVICGNSDSYEHLIEAVFTDYDIPYFTDIAKPVTEHPIILTVLAAFDITDENWSYEAVFKYLRAGFIYEKDGDKYRPFDREDIDILENYVLKYGIRGKSRWFEEWKNKDAGVFGTILNEKSDDVDVQKINSIRERVIKPFETFYERISGRRTVRELAEALFGFLCDINLYNGLSLEIARLDMDGFRNEAEQMKEIWNFLLEAINQTVLISGNEKRKREDFSRMLYEGLSKCIMKIIPSGIDCVSVSDIKRNSSVSPEIAFFVGSIAGTMPVEVHSDGILTDNDRNILSSAEFSIIKSSQEKNSQENFKLYRAVTSVSKKIYISYPTSDLDGNSKQPSQFIRDLIKLFPKILISDNLIDRRKRDVYNAKQAILAYILSESEENREKIKEIYSDEDAFLSRIPIADYSREYKKRQAKINSESARLLYNDYHRYSVSRLNDYSACPFSYYIKHGLGAKEQEIWEIKRFEIGSILHWAICEYCNEVENGEEDFDLLKKKWRELTDEDSEKIVDKIIDDIYYRTIQGMASGYKKIEYLIKRIKKILLRSIKIVRLSLSQGEYTAVCYEEKFMIDIEWNGKSVGINGTIDRIDATKNDEEGRISLRIVDYKSGSKAFSVATIANNADMQLVVYAIAATELYKKGSLGRAGKGLSPQVSGILYNKLKNEIIRCDESDIENVDRLLTSKLKLDGLIIADDDEVLERAQEIDKNLNAKGAKSEFIKLALNSKADGLDKRYSSYIGRESFDILTDYVKKTVVMLDEEIFSGNISVNPLGNNGKTPCSYCKYKEICLYDSKGAFKKVISSEDEAWKHMENEIKKR